MPHNPIRTYDLTEYGVTAFNVRFRESYTVDEIIDLSMDSTCPCYCDACDEYVEECEPDAYEYNCCLCEVKEVVYSLLVFFGIH